MKKRNRRIQQRHGFSAYVTKTLRTASNGKRLVLIRDVRSANTGRLLRDHMWVGYNAFEEFLGQSVRFSAILKAYEKLIGGMGFKVDKIRKVRLLEQKEEHEITKYKLEQSQVSQERRILHTH